MGIHVTKGGMLTVVQDLGRFGYQSYGFIVSGAMDAFAMKIANITVGNPENEAVLEMNFVGPTLLFEENMVISLFGADMLPEKNGEAIAHGKPISVKKGDVLRFHAAVKGSRCYLAVKGGFDLPPVLNSKSTHLSAKIGGFHGRKLESGDRIPIRQPSRILPVSWVIGNSYRHYIGTEDHTIRFVKGRQYDWFTEEAISRFQNEKFQITPQSDRMGYRLEGPSLSLKKSKELITEGATFGSIQVPPNGQPIILMADRQPTGGYPKIGQVIQADLPKLSQMRPGDTIQFQQISLKEAQQILIQVHRELAYLKAAVKLKWRDVAYV
ncbi:biotin-dependent carboxyltransferase family protein [Bacillus smithii]|uniref:5-oxoprolinase subunit C family protein n=1 Tax=Bacillus smithii TaxID=1479 RepID=UPI003D1A1132